MKRQVYLDHNATTPLDPVVLEAMLPYLREEFGNPSSFHDWGQAARYGIEKARHQVAQSLEVSPEQIFFTSCGTESINQVLHSFVEHFSTHGCHIVTSAIEHPAVLAYLQHLEKSGKVTVTLVTPNCDGWVNPGDYEKAITPTTRLLSLMTANNETGVIQPVQEIAAIGKHYGIPVHTDAVQALGKIPFSMKTLGVTYASFSAHKLYGPKGAGCLAINVLGEPSRSGLTSLLHGGSQESGLRSGTENVAGIVGFGAATELAEQKLKQDSARIYALRRMMADLIHTEIPGSHLVPFQAPRLPGTLCICFEEVQGTYVVLDLAEQGIAVSSGSACSSKHSTPSHVLLAMGIDETLAQGAVRFSLGRGITEEQVQWCVEMTRKVVESLRKANPS